MHDMRRRMNKAANAMAALNFIWNFEETALLTKHIIYHAIVVNLLMWDVKTGPVIYLTSRTLKRFIRRLSGAF